jgi:hypothetical protein
MNDMAFMVKHAAATSGGIGAVDEVEMGRFLRRVPMGGIGMKHPIDLV